MTFYFGDYLSPAEIEEYQTLREQYSDTGDEGIMQHIEALIDIARIRYESEENNS